jgi:hypothetical protein
MITASQFAQDLRVPLEIRQEVFELSTSELNGSCPIIAEDIQQLGFRADEVIREYWINSMLTVSEKIGDSKKRPLEQEDIPAVAASLCIQFLMSGAFPQFEQKNAQNLLEGKRAKSEPDEQLDIGTLEASTKVWLNDALSYGKRAESGKPTLLADKKHFIHITKRPEIKLVTTHKHGKLFDTKTQLTLGSSMFASVKKGLPISNFWFNFTPPEPTTLGSVQPLKNVSSTFESKGCEIRDKICKLSKPISLDELFVLTVAKQTGLIKKLPKGVLKVELAQNRKLTSQDTDSFNRLKSAANQAGISFSLTHPMPTARTRINGRVV